MVTRGRPRHNAQIPGAREQRLHPPLVELRRLSFCVLALATTGLGAVMMVDALGGGGLSPLELLILGLFTVTFGWITVAFWTAMAGFVLVALGRDPLSLRRTPNPQRPDPPITSRTALVMPIHNEDPSRVMAGLRAILRSLERTGEGERFDAYVLSDTTDPEIGRAEEAIWARLRDELDLPIGLYYRRRPFNSGRKAGNIADFCRRWGSYYEFMIVLDADSVMSGASVLELVRIMEAEPEAGLIQTLPAPVRQSTLFGRILQFARWLYGPMVASGLSFWQTDTGSYWGHNAIVRVEPFVRHCGLPVLPGSPPLGGEILSHDFVEGALLRRAGWKVFLIPAIQGSYEEVPANILDYAERDRRWSQGNLQHLRLLPVPGLHRVSRAQFLLGAMSYVTSPLWMAMLLASTLYAVLPSGPAVASLPVGRAVTGWNPGAGGLVLPLLMIVLVVLFLPKLLALVLAAARHPGRFGGRRRLLASGVLEMLAAVIITPLMMLYHSHFVIRVLRGRTTRWLPQVREGRAVSWSEASRKTAAATIAGAAWAGIALAHGPALFLWLSPVFGGLLISAPLVRWTSTRSSGEWARRSGLFLAPCETEPSRVLEEACGPSLHDPVDAREAPASVSLEGRDLPMEKPRAMVVQSLLRRPARRP